jgi:hypothetical protein
VNGIRKENKIRRKKEMYGKIGERCKIKMIKREIRKKECKKWKLVKKRRDKSKKKKIIKEYRGKSKNKRRNNKRK